jgi:threonine dehydratase
VRIPDNPGSLARLLDALAATSANVLDVEHMRTDSELSLEDVEVGLQLETRGGEHSAEIVRALRSRGYAVSL